MSDFDKLSKIRDLMPVTRDRVYLNTGSVGPMAKVTVDTLNERISAENNLGRAVIRQFFDFFETMKVLRQSFADLVKADVSTIALTHHTTDGMNIATHGLNWQPGDEVITTNWEHPGGYLPLFIQRQRAGVNLKIVYLDSADSPQTILEKFEAAISPRTRLLVFSHVAWNNGLVLPLKEIVSMAHRHHVLTLVDAAQSTGAIDLDLPDSGVDFYAMPGQKWLCGVEGTGALYVRKESLSLLTNTFAGYKSQRFGVPLDLHGTFMPGDGAARFETGTLFRPGVAAMAANMQWLSEDVGWGWIFGRIQHMKEYASDKLSQLPQVEIITQAGPQAGLVSFNIKGFDTDTLPFQVVEEMERHNIIIRSIPDPICLRISTGFYTSEGDIDKLVAALEAMIANGADALPPYVPPAI